MLSTTPILPPSSQKHGLTRPAKNGTALLLPTEVKKAKRARRNALMLHSTNNVWKLKKMIERCRQMEKNNSKIYYQREMRMTAKFVARESENSKHTLSGREMLQRGSPIHEGCESCVLPSPPLICSISILWTGAGLSATSIFLKTLESIPQSIIRFRTQFVSSHAQWAQLNLQFLVSHCWICRLPPAETFRRSMLG